MSKRSPRKKLNILIELYGNRCYYCDKKLKNEEIHVDHFIAKSIGGKNVISNYRISCCKCNLSKHCLAPEEWIMKLWERLDKAKEEVKYCKKVIDNLNKKELMEGYEN